MLYETCQMHAYEERSYSPLARLSPVLAASTATFPFSEREQAENKSSPHQHSTNTPAPCLFFTFASPNRLPRPPVAADVHFEDLGCFQASLHGQKVCISRLVVGNRALPLPPIFVSGILCRRLEKAPHDPAPGMEAGDDECAIVWTGGIEIVQNRFDQIDML